VFVTKYDKARAFVTKYDKARVFVITRDYSLVKYLWVRPAANLECCSSLLHT